MTAEIPDAEIRDWARSTGRQTTDRGRVSDRLRADYMATMGELGHTIPAAPAPGLDTEPAPEAEAPRGPEKPSKPAPARAEAKPRRVQPAPAPGLLARARAWFNGATTTTTPAGKRTTTPKATPAPRPRKPLTRLVETAWGEGAGIMEHVNIPVARAMAWQAPYVGIVTDDVLKGTPADRLLQVVARAQTSLQGLGAMVAMPVVVGLMTRARPDDNSLAGIARRQVYERILVHSIDAQIEMFGSPELSAQIRRSAEDHARRQKEVDQVTAMLFADLPAVVELPDDASPEQVAEARAVAEAEAAREADLRAAAAAINMMMPVPAGPDLRGQAAVAAAAAIGQSGNAAADAQNAALAALSGP